MKKLPQTNGLEEVEILCHLEQHRNILNLVEYFVADNIVFLKTELCYGGDLLTYIQNKQINEKDAKKIVIQLLDAVID